MQGTQSSRVNFAEERKYLPCSNIWSRAPDKDLKLSAGKWELSGISWGNAKSN